MYVHVYECRFVVLTVGILCFSAELANPEEPETTQLTPNPEDMTFSQSCDLVLHELERPETDGGSGEPVAERDGEVLVDEEAVRQSMELSQRLSDDAIGT